MNRVIQKNQPENHKRMSNNRKIIVIISCLVCTGVTCYVTAITYNNNNNIINMIKNYHNSRGVTIVTFYNNSIVQMYTE